MFRKEEVDGKIVVEASGKALGKATDIAFGLDGSVALIVKGDDNSEVQVSMDRIVGVADYIVVRREQKSELPPEKTVASPAAPPPAPVSTPPPARVNPGIPVSSTPALSSAGAVAPAATSSSAGRVCRGCGAPVRPGAKFCTKCGTPV
jgi:sporulation protein YlmC with PRC-barrel domain/ribosomal protein L40E